MIFHHLSDQPLAQYSCAGPVMHTNPVTSGTPTRNDKGNQAMLRNGSDQTQSVIVKTQFAHPNGRTVRFGAVLPLATWQTDFNYSSTDSRRSDA